MDQAPWPPGASSQPIAPAMSSACWLASSGCSPPSSPLPSSNCRAQRAARSQGQRRCCGGAGHARVNTGETERLHLLRMHLSNRRPYNTMVLSKQMSVSVRSTITMSVSKISRPSCSRQNTAHRWSSTKEQAEEIKKGNLEKLTKSFKCFNLTAALKTLSSPGYDFLTTTV